jgi:hypothetical protein
MVQYVSVASGQIVPEHLIHAWYGKPRIFEHTDIGHDGNIKPSRLQRGGTPPTTRPIDLLTYVEYDEERERRVQPLRDEMKALRARIAELRRDILDEYNT